MSGLRDGARSGLEAAALHRITDLDGRLRAFTQVFTPPVAGRPGGPLSGIPVAVKDSIDVGGRVTTLGRPPGERPPAGADAAVVAALRAAGASIVGKTNLSEFASSAVTDNAAYGATRNPADLSRTAGGSSGGSAAAVAAGLVPVAVGTDTAGSVLMPAALTGCCGLRPTHGRLDLAGIAPLSPSLDTVGLFADRPDDLALVFDALLGGDAGPGATGLDGLRIGVLGGYFRDGAPAVLAAVDDALERLRAAGARTVAVTLPSAADAVRHGRAIYLEEAARSYAQLLDPGRAYAPTVEARRHGAPDAAEARAFVPAWRAEVRAALDGIDLLAAPAVPVVAPELPVDEAAAGLTRFTYPICLAGGPALSIPCAAPGALPVGLLLAGRPGSDTALLAAGDAVWAALTPNPAKDPA